VNVGEALDETGPSVMYPVFAELFQSVNDARLGFAEATRVEMVAAKDAVVITLRVTGGAAPGIRLVCAHLSV
jgi:hypothetical protein